MLVSCPDKIKNYRFTCYQLKIVCRCIKGKIFVTPPPPTRASPVTSYQLLVTSYQLLVTSYQVPASYQHPS